MTWNESLVEVEWPNKRSAQILLIEGKRIEHGPGLIDAIVQTRDEVRDKALAALNRLKSSS